MEYLVVIVVAALLGLANCQSIIQKPKNTAGVIGGTVELTCEADLTNDVLEWRYFPSGGTGTRIWISADGKVLNGNFQIRNEGNKYTLVLPVLKEELASLYVCKLLVKDEEAVAKITALNNFNCLPTWEPPPMPPNPPEVIQDADMVFTCSVKHVGELVPKLEWYKDDAPIATYVIDDPTTNVITATANVTAKADLDEVPFECRLLFDYVQAGSFPPEYTDQCSTYYQVVHAATNIQTFPEPEYEGEVLSVEIGSFINCTASGRPVPQIHWFDKETYETFEGDRLEITPELAGEHTWVCHAENVIMGNPRFAEREVTFKAEGYATDSPYAPSPPAKASTQPWVIAIAVIIPLLFIALVLFLGFYCVKKRRAKGKSEKPGIPSDEQDPMQQQSLMYPSTKPKATPSARSQGDGTPNGQDQADMHRAGSQGRIYKPRSQGQINRQASQGPPYMYGSPGQAGANQPQNPQMYRGSQDRLDQAPNPQMYRPPSQDRLDQAPNPQMYRPRSQDRLDQSPNPQMYRPPSQDRLDSSGQPQAAPRTKLSRSRENLANQEPEPKPRPRGSIDQPLTGYGLMADDATLKKSRENLASDNRPKTLPKPKSREDLSQGTGSGPPTAPKPKNMHKLGVQVLPPPPQRHQSADTEV